MPVNTGIQVTDSVRHTVEKRYPGDHNVDSGFRRNHRKQDRLPVDKFRPFGFRPRGIQLDR